MKTSQKVILIILDGWGIREEAFGNPILVGDARNFEYLFRNFPSTLLFAHGKYVGLPDDQEGNSEAGHQNIGAGRVIIQDSVLISRKIQDGSFFKNKALKEVISHVKKNQSKLHLMGLLSGKSTSHSSPDHLFALIQMAREEKVKKVILHLFTDGRDSSPHSAVEFLGNLKRYLKNGNFDSTKFLIATICGRVFAMDRKKDWRNIEKAYNLLVLGEGNKASSPEEAIVHAYNLNLTDEFIPPTIIDQKEKVTIDDNDGVIFFNLRGDRGRELTRAFLQKDFEKRNEKSFKRKKVLKNLKFVTFTDFGKDLDGALVAFPREKISNTLPWILKDFEQLYLSEAEKFPHVTFFFNGGFDHPLGKEERIRIPSPRVLSYAAIPEMSLPEVIQTLKERLSRKRYHFVCVNFANPDMIGHTGSFQSALDCVKIVDEALNQVVNFARTLDYNILIIADHGNIEEMIDKNTGEVITKHTKNPVPFIFVPSKKFKLKKIKLKKGGALANIAPTILKIMGLKIPNEMADPLF
jgi:2,3-bisphosphoglycerate-independent phosphoglycerate mutase